MDFYTSFATSKDNFLIRGVENGKRIKRIIPAKPYLFVPTKSKSPKYHTTDNKGVDRIDFNSISEARDFIKQYKNVGNFTIFGSDRFEYPYINDTFPDDNIHYEKDKIIVANIDIECLSLSGGFPNIDKATDPITAISIIVKNRVLTFAFKDYTGDFKENLPEEIDDFIYFKSKDEKEMLSKFVEVFVKIAPDVITGWNVEGFDIPFIVNRIKRVLGNTFANSLSPWGLVRKKVLRSHGQDRPAYDIIGIQTLDYLNLYKKFTHNLKESYTLNYISHIELNEKKLDYSGHKSLDELYKNDFNLYIDYNIRDTLLVNKFEKKLGFLELVYAMAYNAKINYQDTMASVQPWEIIIHNHLMKKNVVVPPRTDAVASGIKGGFVKEPMKGMHNWVISFDLTSLYPHLIMQHNISPDVYLDHYEDIDVMDDILNGRSVSKKDGVLCANGCLYSKERDGIFPELMKIFFKKRNEYKAVMLEYKQKKEKTGSDEFDDEISRYNAAQMALKTFLNAFYGALAHDYFRFYSAKNAEAITLSGQLAIKWISQKLNEYMNDLCNTENNDYVIAVDTDSVYLSFEKYVSQTDFDDQNICDCLDNFCKLNVEPFIDQSFKELQELVNANENFMHMKREVISDRAIWKAKKMYALNVLDSEGVRFKDPEIKIMGIEAIRSSVPEISRSAIKDALKIILRKDLLSLKNFVNEYKDKFMKSSPEEISFPRGVNGLYKYSCANDIFMKGCPIHTKGALIYNHFLKKYGIENIYEPIVESSKIKFSYLKIPNPFFQEVIAWPGELPEEFDIEKYLDKEKQFEKTFLGPIRSIADIIGWELERKNTVEGFFE